MRTLLLLLVVATAVQAQPRRGEPAPDPGIGAFLNAPAGASWIDTDGQAVVLDFWATWCAPCVASIPHLNAVADSVAGRPVRFISVTAEPADVVAPFLLRRPIRGWVGLDADSSAAPTFGITGIPQTVLIGRDGRLAAIVHPTAVTVAMIDSLLAGLPLARPDRAARSMLDSVYAQARRLPMPDRATTETVRARWMAPGERRPSYSRAGRPIDPPNRRAWWEGSLGFLFLISPADVAVGPDGIPRNGRVVGPDSLLSRSVSFEITAPDIPEAIFRPYVFDVLNDALGISIRDETRPVDVLILRQSEAGLRLARSTGGARTSGAEGVLSARGASLGQIARMLDTCLEMPVIDETGVEGTFEMQLLMDPAVVHCDRPDPAQNAAVRAALRETAGLDLVPETRDLPVVVVEPRL